ncbi:MAG: T9SS type A sorting domain-containing protein, partial [Bacteroidota bacterium]
TASEINNKGFEVLRSLDGINFEKVGFVNGNNNSTTAHTYHFDDHNVVAGREYYYRLNQVDNNGKKEESKIVSSIIHGNTSIIIGELYPNPTSSNASVDITVFQNTSVRIKMIDAIGKQVINTTSELVTGTNKINLNMSHLSEGVYIVSIQVGEDTIQKRIIITK